METEVLQLLPARGLDRSLLLAVLAGLWILWFFVERLGWVFSGLVVPGYLAAVFIVRPISGVAIAVEAVLTYLVARLVSDLLARAGGWSRFFGRERFFLILLVSVLVRQHCELWLFPRALDWARASLGVDLSYQEQLFGVGLVLVPLAANMFWKLDLRRGLVQIGVPTALTWAALFWLILPFTNYGLSSLELTYEDVAVNFLGSAKIYVILLTTAALAAAMNLYAGWDYSGILVPALLSVAWFTPVKVLTTVVEALVLLGAVGLLSRRWPLRRLNLEGPRKIVLVFTVGFGLKALVATFIGDRLPGLEVTDLFGFGYLVPSLLAIKMLTRRTVGRVLGPTLVVSVAGLIVGSGLALVVEWGAELTPGRSEVARPAVESPSPGWRDPLAVAIAASLQADPVDRAAPPFEPASREQLASLWRLVDRWLSDGRGAPPEGVVERAAKLGIRLDPIVDTAGPAAGDAPWAMTEAAPSPDGFNHTPSAVLYPGRSGPYVWVPRPATEAPAAEAAVVLCARLECRAVIFAGVEPRSGALRWHRPILDALGGRGVVQLHADPRTAEGQPVMHVFGSAPAGVFLGMMGSLPAWDPAPGRLRAGQPDLRRAILRMHPADLWRLLVEEGRPATLDAPDIDSWLAGRLALEALAPGPAVGPTPFEQRLVARVLTRGAVEGPPAGFPDDRAWTVWLDRVARLVRHRFVEFDEALTGRRVRAMIGAPGTPGWLVLLAAQGGSTTAVEVPRPMRQAGTWRFGLSLWREVDGVATLIAMPRRAANGAVEGAPTGSASAFDAVHVGLHASLSRGQPGMVVQVRGFGAWRSLEHDSIVALEMPLFTDEPVPVAIEGLLSIPLLAPLDHGLYTSSGFPGVPPPGLFARRPQAELIGLINQPNAQRDHARRQLGARFVRLWLSEAVRTDYLDRDPRPLHPSLDAALGLPLALTGRAALADPPLDPPPAEPSAALAEAFEAAFDEARGFARTGNPHRLRALLEMADADPRLAVRRGFSPSEGRVWYRLEVAAEGEVHRAVVYRSARAARHWVAAPDARVPPVLRGYASARVHGRRPEGGGP